MNEWMPGIWIHVEAAWQTFGLFTMTAPAGRPHLQQSMADGTEH